MSFTSELRSYSLHDSNAVRSYEIEPKWKTLACSRGPTLGGSHIFLCNATCDTSESPPLATVKLALTKDGGTFANSRSTCLVLKVNCQTLTLLVPGAE